MVFKTYSVLCTDQIQLSGKNILACPSSSTGFGPGFPSTTGRAVAGTADTGLLDSRDATGREKYICRLNVPPP